MNYKEIDDFMEDLCSKFSIKKIDVTVDFKDGRRYSTTLTKPIDD